ncbi:MAG TPA: cobalt ECF transporter T component CbiQ [Syntrophomonas sp.]|nr:cobalt ECF transporter T component CbiQ [Syntrophomonas sp.]
MIPDWMDKNPGYDDLAVSGRRSHSFLGKSIRHMKKTISEELVTEYYARSRGLLQGIDPRVKLISAVSLIILAGITRSISVLLGLWAITILLMFCSGLPVFTLQKRIWGLLPLFSLLVALPGMFNLITDGSPWLVLHQFKQPVVWLGIHLPDSIFITKQGLLAGIFLFLRVGISVSLGVLLTITTPINKLLKSLRIIGVPVLFVMIIEMSYRYLSMLLNISIEMFEARHVRTVGKISPGTQRVQLGSSIAALFARSMAVSEEVYQAMTARCYTGEAVIADNMKLGRFDLAAIVLVIIIITSAVMGGPYIG